MLFDKSYYLECVKNEARKLVFKGFEPKCEPCERLMQIIHIPSFEPIVSWEIFNNKDNEQHQYFVVKSFWDMESDERKLDIPHLDLKLRYNKFHIEPTIINKKISLNVKIVEDIVAKLKNIKISPIPDNCPVGCDGTSYRLVLGNIFNNIEIEWWSHGPENWNELSTLIEDMINRLGNIE